MVIQGLGNRFCLLTMSNRLIFSAKNRQIILMHTPFCWYGSHLCTYVCFREFKKKFRAVQRHQSADGAWGEILKNSAMNVVFNIEKLKDKRQMFLITLIMNILWSY